MNNKWLKRIHKLSGRLQRLQRLRDEFDEEMIIYRNITVGDLIVKTRQQLRRAIEEEVNAEAKTKTTD